ncbi:Up-regulated during septation-domain-containing protein [Xylogone sp. PMI_703]|nr:Up-regulated during septation-domain-containing protein [Xylogone sp. PMI_703]
MNGYGDTQNYGAVTQNARGPPGPSGTVILDGYRNDILNGFEGEKPRYNPLNTTRPQSSMLVNVNDPIQVHLLVETALGDSKEFEILSQEEVDDLKKQCQVLTQRIEQARQNLAIQSKYRDAAMSMTKLYNSDRKKSIDATTGKNRRSILGQRRNSDQLREAETERMASERKCEELAAELWTLEKRLIEPQTRLLKHTAGILQMTHKGPKIVAKGAMNIQQPGMPGSPESMYTYSNARNSVETFSEENFFDERSLYKSAERLEGYGPYGTRDSFEGRPKSRTRGETEQLKMIATTEQGLEDLNARLRQIIVKLNPKLNEKLDGPPLTKSDSNGRATEVGAMLGVHIDYLGKSIIALDQECERTLDAKETANVTVDNFDKMETVVESLWDFIQSGEAKARERRDQDRQARAAKGLPPNEEDDLSADDGGDPSEAFSLPGFAAKVKWLYSQASRLKDQKIVLQRQIKQQRELNNRSDAQKDAEIVHKTEELEETKALLLRTEMETDTVREQLSTVMEKLNEVTQRERLREQSRAGEEAAATRGIKEELGKSEERIAQLEEELQELKDDHAISAAETQTKIGELESQIESLSAELAAAKAAQSAAEEAVKQKEQEVEQKGVEIGKKEKDLEEMSMDVARLQTEVTIARAELDGAYGSRAERAAEVAANPAIQREIDELSRKNATLTSELADLQAGSGATSKEMQSRIDVLKKELEETIEEYEQMTKLSIEWEKEREALEGSIDKLRDEKESLETQLSEEKVKWLGIKSPGDLTPGGTQANATSTTVLKNEFKKMMRDARAESMKALRAEQAERRRLEEELRTLRRQNGPGKSALSRSIPA